MNQSIFTVREVFHSPVAADRSRALELLAQTWLRAVAGRDQA